MLEKLICVVFFAELLFSEAIPLARMQRGRFLCALLFQALLDTSGFVENPGDCIGKVLVADGEGSLRRALRGDSNGAANAKNGQAGGGIDGCARDVNQLATLMAW